MTTVVCTKIHYFACSKISIIDSSSKGKCNQHNERLNLDHLKVIILKQEDRLPAEKTHNSHSASQCSFIWKKLSMNEIKENEHFEVIFSCQLNTTSVKTETKTVVINEAHMKDEDFYRPYLNNLVIIGL